MAKDKQESPASVINESVAMDTRKFLSAINNSAQSQIAFFEDAVRKLGEQHGQEWKLTSLQSNRIIIENAQTHEFMMADHTREKGGHIRIANIKKIDLHEDRKPELFENSCLALVEAIQTGDNKKIDIAYNKVAASRFRSTAVPTNGLVKTKDGVVRHIAIDEGTTLGERLVELLTDRYVLSESGSLEGIFSTDNLNDLNLGVTELTTRKLVALNMREVAEHAYTSPNFQTMVEAVAGLICKKNLEQAITYSAKFLREHQEFSLLNKRGWVELIGNTLATKLHFNEDLIKDTATLMRKTNLKVNREELVDAWRKTAEKARHPVMLENVDKLAAASTTAVFADAYESFLDVMLEATGEMSRGALIAGLEMLRQRVAKDEVEDPTGGELDTLIQDLQQEGDSAAMYKAMETLDSVRRHIDSMKGLDDFDEMTGPGADIADEAEAEAGGGVGGAGIGGAEAGLADADVSGGGEKPLEVSIKMDPAQMAQNAQAEQPAADMADADEGKFDLGDLEDIDLEGGEEELEGGEEEEELPKKPALAAGLEKDEEPISEDFANEFLKAEGIDGPEPDDIGYRPGRESKVVRPLVGDSVSRLQNDGASQDLGEIVHVGDTQMGGEMCVVAWNSGGREELPCDDLQLVKAGPKAIWKIEDIEDGVPNDGMSDYALPEDLQFESIEIDEDYGTIVEDDVDDASVSDFSDRLKTSGSQDEDPATLQAAAEAYIREKMADKVGGITDPAQQQKQVNDLAGLLLAKRMQNQKLGEGKITENQYKSPLTQLSKRGLKRTAISQLVKEGNLQWLGKEDKAVLGEFKGIKFVVDHSEDPVAILSADGSITVPIPEDLVSGALYLSEISDDEAEADMFVEWLDQTIESLRTESDIAIEEPVVESSDEETTGDSETVVEEENVDEGVEHLKKFQFKKKGANAEAEAEKPAEEEKQEEPAEEEKPAVAEESKEEPVEEKAEKDSEKSE